MVLIALAISVAIVVWLTVFRLYGFFLVGAAVGVSAAIGDKERR